MLLLLNALTEPARGLFSICAFAAAMELLAGDKRGVAAFQSVCALAVATLALRLVSRLLGL